MANSESIYRRLFPHSSYAFSDKEIVQHINQAKENANVELSILEAISHLEQMATENYLAEHTPSDREMHRAGCF